MPPGFPELAASAKADVMKRIELLLEHSAEPDASRFHYSDDKTSRELAAGKSEIFDLFNLKP